MIDREITKTLEALQRATGHDAWQWNDHDAFYIAELDPRSADLVSSELEGLDSRVSRDERDGKVTLTIHYQDIVNFIANEPHDRPHVTQPIDPLQEYLTLNHKQFVWQPTQGGYVGYGYNLADEEALKEPFLKAGVRLKPTTANTNHDGPTHGLFISENAVSTLMQRQLGAERS